jgi:hypothetical protein
MRTTEDLISSQMCSDEIGPHAQNPRSKNRLRSDQCGGVYRFEISANDPSESHVCRRWCDCGSLGKMGLVAVLVLLVVVTPLQLGIICMVQSVRMGSEVYLVQLVPELVPEPEPELVPEPEPESDPSPGTDGSWEVDEPSPAPPPWSPPGPPQYTFEDPCQAFTEPDRYRYCSGTGQSWKIQSEPLAYVCITKTMDPKTRQYETDYVATWPCKGNTPNTDLSPDRDNQPCVLPLVEASPEFNDLQSALLVAGLVSCLSILPGCIGPCWVCSFMDRKSSAHCGSGLIGWRGCVCCPGVDYRTMGDRAAEATRKLAGCCLCITVGFICIGEIFMLWSAMALTDSISYAEYSCGEDVSDSSDSLSQALSLERELWLVLGLKYSATVAACCLPLVLEWANQERQEVPSVFGAGGQNYKTDSGGRNGGGKNGLHGVGP